LPSSILIETPAEEKQPEVARELEPEVALEQEQGAKEVVETEVVRELEPEVTMEPEVANVEQEIEMHSEDNVSEGLRFHHLFSFTF
jgi:hypothetical protein